MNKIEGWKEKQGTLYPEGYYPNCQLKDFNILPGGKNGISLAGRVLSIKHIGQICFMNLFSMDGEAQVFLSKQHTADFEFLCKNIDLGDHVFTQGFTFHSNVGTLTLHVEKLVMLSKAHYPFTSKWYGIHDEETITRKPYLSLLANKEHRQVLQSRFSIVQAIKNVLIQEKFLEVETPILQHVASGAVARPFRTHYNALNQDFFLRIAPEIFLKTMMVAGYNKIFEIGKCFRNEGIDDSHLQEFTMLECYAAYWTYKDHIELTKKLILAAVDEVSPNRLVHCNDGIIDFNLPWKEVSYRDWVMEKTGIDVFSPEEDIKSYLEKEKIHIPTGANRYDMVELLYKKKCCLHQKNPIIITKYPSFICPLAKSEGEELLMFQLVVDGIELVKVYSELIDPIIQEKNFRTSYESVEDKENAEYVRGDEEFVEAMKYGMPPMAGLGLGIDRLVKILTNSKNIRRVVFFAPARTKNEQNYLG